MPYKALAYALLCLALCCASPAAAQNIPGAALSGPVAIRNQYPHAMLHHSLAPQQAATLEEGRARAALQSTWSNTCAIEDRYSTDLETVVTGFSFDYGVMPGLEITSYLPVVWRGGGGLDQVIDGWHSFFSLPRGDRRRVSDDAYSLSGDNEDGSEFAIEQEGWGLGVGSLGLKYQLPAAGETKISTLFQLGLPGTTGYAQQSLEILQGLVAERCSAATCYYLGGAGLYASDQVVQGLRQRAFHAEWFAGAQYQWNPKIQLLATLYGSTKAVSGVINHPNYALYLDLGARVLLTEATALEAILRENPGPGAGTVDVSFHLGLSRGF